MKLTDLDPRWIGPGDGRKTGFYFRCPCCLDKEEEFRIGIYFKEPIRGGEPAKEKLWTREGDTFETLTIKPSINAEKFGHWHGHITNGEIK